MRADVKAALTGFLHLSSERDCYSHWLYRSLGLVWSLPAMKGWDWGSHLYHRTAEPTHLLCEVELCLVFASVRDWALQKQVLRWVWESQDIYWGSTPMRGRGRSSTGRATPQECDVCPAKPCPAQETCGMSITRRADAISRKPGPSCPPPHRLTRLGRLGKAVTSVRWLPPLKLAWRELAAGG